MFVRVKKSPSDSNKEYVQIVQSFRTGNKVSQKIVRHVGVSRDKEEFKKLLSLGEFIKLKLENNSQILLFSPENLSQTNEKLLNQKIEKIDNQKENDYKVSLKNLIEEQRIVNGIHDIYGLLFDELRYQNVFPNPARCKSTIKTF